MRRKISIDVPKEVFNKFNKEFNESDCPIRIVSCYLTIIMSCPSKYKHDFKWLLKEMKRGGRK